jgi:dipeptidyl-peptidase-4
METANSNIRYTTITTEDGVTMDAWINSPKNFDSTKKYPVVFYVYGEACFLYCY